MSIKNKVVQKLSQDCCTNIIFTNTNKFDDVFSHHFMNITLTNDTNLKHRMCTSEQFL